MKFNIATLEVPDTGDDMETDAQRKLFENVSPAMRGGLARDVMSEYRRWVLKQIADASRSGATERLQEMEALKEKLAGEFDLVIRGDEGVIKRTLTEYRAFLSEVNKGQTPKNDISGGLNGGPT